MHVLILGANGMLGRALQRAFESEEVVAWDREELDITDADAVAQHLPRAEPDLVINAAAYTDVDGAELLTERAELVNGRAVEVLAKTCAATGIPLLHVSTDYVFSGTQEAGYTEDDVPQDPCNAYGRSKLLGEELLRASTAQYWLVRTSWLFGPHGKHFVDTMLRLGAEKKDLRVVADQHGSPTYTKDLARAIFSLVSERAPFGVYHLTNSGVTTWAEYAQAIFELAGMAVHVTPIAAGEFPTRARRPAWSILRNRKRPPLRHWREALADYLRIRHLERP